MRERGEEKCEIARTTIEAIEARKRNFRYLLRAHQFTFLAVDPRDGRHHFYGLQSRQKKNNMLLCYVYGIYGSKESICQI